MAIGTMLAVIGAGAGQGMLSSIMGTNAAGDKAMDEAEAVGIQNAQTKASAARLRGAQPGQLTAINDNRVQAETDVALAQEQAESDARVQAAAAGVSGDSVESVIQETEANAGRAVGSIDMQTENAFEKLRQSRIDLSLETDAALLRPNFKSTGGMSRLLVGGLSGGVKAGMGLIKSD